MHSWSPLHRNNWYQKDSDAKLKFQKECIPITPIIVHTKRTDKALFGIILLQDFMRGDAK